MISLISLKTAQAIRETGFEGEIFGKDGFYFLSHLPVWELKITWHLEWWGDSWSVKLHTTIGDFRLLGANPHESCALALLKYLEIKNQL